MFDYNQQHNFNIPLQFNFNDLITGKCTFAYTEIWYQEFLNNTNNFFTVISNKYS